MYILAYDLGTGGLKASLFDENLSIVSSLFSEYKTNYPDTDFHVQKPGDWWNAVRFSTKTLIEETGVNPKDVKCISLSGSSLVPVLLGENDELLVEEVPIWSDKRATKETEEFFNIIDEDFWYLTTGNGFPSACYPIFKLMWYGKHEPELYSKIKFVLGSKDYINFLLTGVKATDYSYASGSGFYSLTEKKYKKEFLEAAGLPFDWFPSPVSSHTVLGNLTAESAFALGLTTETKVVAGGVDNACMALGAVGNEDGKVYVSLGTSTWIPVNTKKPLLDVKTKPYTFAHIDENLFTSAYSIFSGGNSLRWVRNVLCPTLPKETAYSVMCDMAMNSPVGANGVMFHPGLAGGTGLDKSQHIRGGFMGITLGTDINDLIRATLEGVAFNLKLCLEQLKTLAYVDKEIYFFGGGSKSNFWLQIFSDVFSHPIVKTAAEQETASIGAAGIALRGVFGYENYDFMTKFQKRVFRCEPNSENSEKYRELAPLFGVLNDLASEYGQKIHDYNKKLKS